MGVYFKRGGKVGMPQQFLRDLRVNARIVQYGSIFVPQRVAVYVAGPHSTPRFAAPFLVLVGQPMRPAEPFPAFIQSGFADRGSAAYEIISGKMRAALCKDLRNGTKSGTMRTPFSVFVGDTTGRFE